MRWCKCLTAMVAVTALAGCGPQQQAAVENTTAQTGNTVENAAVAAGNTVTNAAAKVEATARPVLKQAGQALSDSGVTLKVKTALAASAKLDASGINVDTENHIVYLRGTVPDAAEKAVAESLANNIVSAGTKVIDELQVAGAPLATPNGKSTPAARSTP